MRQHNIHRYINGYPYPPQTCPARLW